MSIGRTFCEALQKAARSLETGRDGLVSRSSTASTTALLAEPKKQRDLGDGGAPSSRRRRRFRRRSPDELVRGARARSSRSPTADRLFYVADAMRVGHHADESPRAHRRSTPGSSRSSSASSTPRSASRRGDARRRSCSARASASASRDAQIAQARGHDARTTSARCARSDGVAPVYARVDTCAAEFVAHTPYLYSTYEIGERGRAPTRRRRRSSSSAAARTASGRGSSSTTAACTPCMALRELGLETIMVNCNPETVSTDYDTSRSPLLRAAHARGRARDLRRGEARGRHRAVRRADAAQARGAAREAPACKLLGTTADAIDRAEDRERFDELLDEARRCGGRASGIAHGVDEAFDDRRARSATRCSCARATCSAGAR